MNYITVSIPLLLVFAGFNHAHGLTTFGKSNTNNQQPSSLDSKAKQCTVQANCTTIKNTTCLRGLCLCGDNRPPNNAACTATLMGPNHICTKNDDCVNNADCIAVKDVTPLKNDIAHLLQVPEISICRCIEGPSDIGATCGGEAIFAALSFLTLCLAMQKVFY